MREGGKEFKFTLLSIAGKLLASVLLNRLIPTIAQKNTPESQCGFRSNRVTVDMIFVLRQIREKCREQNMGLYAAFVDLTKVFDTVSLNGLWNVLARQPLHNLAKAVRQERLGRNPDWYWWIRSLLSKC